MSNGTRRKLTPEEAAQYGTTGTRRKLEPEEAGAPAIPEGPERSVGGAFMHGVVQGGTLGFGDEFQGALGAYDELGKKGRRLVGLEPEVGPDENIFGAPSLGEAYTTARNEARGDDEAFKKAHPVAYTAGDLVGSMAVPMAGISKGGSALARLGKYALQGAAMGGASAVGRSDAPLDSGETAKSLGIGAAIGAPAGMLGGAIGDKLASKAAAARQAAQDASQKLADKGFASARGALGGEVSSGARTLEVLEKAASDPSLPEDVSRAAADFLSGPEAQALREQVARSSLSRGSDNLGRIQAARDAMAEAGERLTPEAIEAATNARLSPGAAGKALGSRMKTLAQRFGPAVVLGSAGAGAGGWQGALLGTLAGSGIGAGLGKPGTIIANALKDPAVVYNASRVAEPVVRQGLQGVADEQADEDSMSRSALARYFSMLGQK